MFHCSVLKISLVNWPVIKLEIKIAELIEPPELYLKSKIRLSILLDLKFAKTSVNSSSKVEVNWLYNKYPDLPSEFSIISEWKMGFFSKDTLSSHKIKILKKFINLGYSYYSSQQIFVCCVMGGFGILA